LLESQLWLWIVCVCSPSVVCLCCCCFDWLWICFDTNVFGHVCGRAVESGGSTRNSREDLYGSRNYRGSNSSLNDGRFPPFFYFLVCRSNLFVFFRFARLNFCWITHKLFHLFYVWIWIFGFMSCCLWVVYLFIFIFYLFLSMWQLTRTRRIIHRWCIPGGRVVVSWQVWRHFSTITLDSLFWITDVENRSTT
jgi:hypothetical protein